MTIDIQVIPLFPFRSNSRNLQNKSNLHKHFIVELTLKKVFKTIKHHIKAIVMLKSIMSDMIFFIDPKKNQNGRQTDDFV